MVEPQDYWLQMRRFTTARIGLGRAGVAVPTKALLEFQLAAARARDAVYAEFDIASIVREAAPADVILVASQAEDRSRYLLRPDLGRVLAVPSAACLAAARQENGYDLVFVIADGLSAAATVRYAPRVFELCRQELAGLSIGPLVIASQARVALADEIGELLDARMVMILLGERPGLTTAESMGIYFTWNPKIGTLDSARNCISNVHDEGLGCQAAGRMAAWLVREATRLKVSGTGLKENAPSALDELSMLSRLEVQK